MTKNGVPPRERYREQMQAEIKQQAWQQIAATGVSALSLNAIARDLGMTGPALYRYFANRDDLVTALVRDAYRSLADAVRDARRDGADLAGVAQALRRWALADPHRYLLIYGTPIPGYRAPADTAAISDEILTVVADACADDDVAPSGTAFEARLQDHSPLVAALAVPPPVLRMALLFWTRLHGVLSLELAGHFTGTGVDPAVLFADEVAHLRRR